MARGGHRWTEEDDADLLLMRSRGLTLIAVGQVLGCTRDAAAGRLAKLRHPPERIEHRAAGSCRRRPKFDPVPAAVLRLAVCGPWRPAA